MRKLSRRLALGGLGAVPLAMPGLIRAQGSSKPVRLGMLSDMGGPYPRPSGSGRRSWPCFPGRSPARIFRRFSSPPP